MNREFRILLDTVEMLSTNIKRSGLPVEQVISLLVRRHPLNQPRWFRRQVSTADVISALKAFCKVSGKVCPYIEKL